MICKLCFLEHSFGRLLAGVLFFGLRSLGTTANGNINIKTEVLWWETRFCHYPPPHPQPRNSVWKPDNCKRTFLSCFSSETTWVQCSPRSLLNPAAAQWLSIFYLNTSWALSPGTWLVMSEPSGSLKKLSGYMGATQIHTVVDTLKCISLLPLGGFLRPLKIVFNALIFVCMYILKWASLDLLINWWSRMIRILSNLQRGLHRYEGHCSFLGVLVITWVRARLAFLLCVSLKAVLCPLPVLTV